MNEVKTYYIDMQDTITNQVFTVVVCATSLYEARRAAWMDWYMSAKLVG